MDLTAKRSSREFLLMPVPPTPNGPLHLGHMSGPYLRTDILARYFRSVGHSASLIVLSDSFDSYVLLKAYQEKRSPDEVCSYYHEKIRLDFQLLDIDTQAFWSLAEEGTAKAHGARLRAAMDELIAKGVTTTVSEKVLYCPATGRYICGAWLQGKCPVCTAEAGGFYCEKCGALFSPEAILEPRARLEDTPLEWRNVESLFLRLDDVPGLMRYAERAGAAPQCIEWVERCIRTQGPIFRLTFPGTWGTAWPPDRFGNPRVLFLGGWDFALTSGRAYAEVNGLDIDPFHTESPVTSIVGFGLDNAVPWLAGTPALMSALSDCRPVDYTLTNFFYNLQGEKFSTSRGHAIWVADIIQKTPACSDAVRYFLARVNPEHAPANFDVREFVACVNDILIGKFQRTVLEAVGALEASSPGAASAESIAVLERFLGEQEKAFALGSMSLAKVPRIIEAWLDERPDPPASRRNETYLWLKGLAFLAAPVMPGFAACLWQTLGFQGQPVLGDLLAVRVPQPWRGKPPFERLSVEALVPCLPAGLSQALSA